MNRSILRWEADDGGRQLTVYVATAFLFGIWVDRHPSEAQVDCYLGPFLINLWWSPR